MGSAEQQSQLWGACARDYADLQENGSNALFEAVLQAAKVGSGTALLDVGCGSGIFCGMAAEAGAQVSGLDATEPLLAIARERVPQGDFRSGEMETLPYADDAFDLVTGFNAFQFAASPVNALKEARRVARPNGRVVIAVFGKREDVEAADYLAAVGSLLPPPPPGTPGPFALSANGALEALVSQAGFVPQQLEEVDCLWTYPDEQTALRGFLSSGPSVLAIQLRGEETVADAILKAIAPYKTDSGGYQLRNRTRYLIART